MVCPVKNHERPWARSVCHVPGWPLGAVAAGSLLSPLALWAVPGVTASDGSLLPLWSSSICAQGRKDCNCIENLS